MKINYFYLLIYLLISSFGYSQTNLLKNPSFEESFTLSSENFEDWYMDFNTTRTKVTDATDQTYAVKIQTNRPATTGFFAELSAATPSNDLDFENGKTYTISFDYKVVTDTVSELRASLLRDNFYLEHENIVNNLTDTGWQTMTYDFIATHTASHNFDINIKSNSASTEIIIDNASITEKPFNPDRDALIALYNATDGPNWVQPWDLNSPDISTWHGVTLDENDRVKYIIIQRNGLVGPIPPEIGELSQLSRLELQNNKLSGNIPAEIGQLENLTSLLLSNNELEGTIPIELGQLSKLVSLELVNNNLSGNIPAEIGELKELTGLYLSKNKLTGNIPKELSQLSSLLHLYLSENELSGPIPPELGQLTQLGLLYLNMNSLDGTIPIELEQMSELRSLFLSENKFTGSIPEGMRLFPFLRSVNFSSNSLSGKIPTFISPDLTIINVARNQYVFEDIIDMFHEKGENVDFYYSSQANIGKIQDTILKAGENFSLIITQTTLPNNSYQWRKDGIAIENATGSEYLITDFSEDDQGIYDCVITNDVLPDLKINLNSVSIFGDGDGDGVLDNIDICPNTPSGALVDNRGCSYLDVLVPKPDDITAKVTSTSCVNMNNGEIALNFKVSQTHHINITGPDNFSENYTKHNGSSLIISNLMPGTYNLLVNSDIGRFLGAPNTIFNLNIETPESFMTGKAVVDYTNKSAKMSVSGSKKYEVLVNKELLTYTFDDTGVHELNFKLQDGINTIEAKTDKICQGSYNENILLNKVIVTPNPTADNVKILGLTNTNKAKITLFNSSGIMVKQFNKVIKDATTSISIAELPLGLYTITVESNEQVIHLKVIKK